MLLKNKIIDKTILMILLVRTLNSVAGFFTIYFVFSNLSESSQGAYYTFVNLIGFNIFFEFGISTLVIQHISHLMAKVAFAQDRFDGPEDAITQLYAFIKNTFRFAATLSAIMIMALSLIGIYIIKDYSDLYMPWLLLVLVTGLSFMMNVIVNMVEGAGRLNDVAKIRMIATIISLPILWLGLSKGWGMYALPLQTLGSTVCLVTWMVLKYRIAIMDIYHKSQATPAFLDYFKTILPLQKRLSLSFLSAYLSTPFFAPLIFATGDVNFAGKFGVTMQAFTAINGFAITWINSKLALFGTKISRGEHDHVLKEFKSLFMTSLYLLLAFLAALWLVIITIKFNDWSYQNRFLDSRSLILLTISALATHVYLSVNTYLLAFKLDPLFKLNLLRISFILASVSLIINFKQPNYIFYIYVFNTLFISMFGSILMFYRFNIRLGASKS